MGPLVRENHGFIDKYMGDAIMALFDREAEDAVSAAIVMLQRLAEYNQGRKRAGYRPIQIGIGINTGDLILGTLGEHNRMEGTVISDAVNVASRLEGLTKKYGVPLLISEHTFHELKDPARFSIRFVDRVLVKGKSAPVSVYEVFDVDPQEHKESKLINLKMFEKALYFFHFDDINEAHALFQQYCLENPFDTIAKIYLKRCKDIKEKPQFEKDKNAIVWSHEYSNGILQIDNQHQQMFDLINQLMEVIKCGKGKEEFFRTMINLKSVTKLHSETEEDLMVRFGYPDYENHKIFHKSYGENFARLTKVIKYMGYKEKEEGLHLLLRIQHLLAEWLFSHVNGSDKKLGDYLKQHKFSR